MLFSKGQEGLGPPCFFGEKNPPLECNHQTITAITNPPPCSVICPQCGLSLEESVFGKLGVVLVLRGAHPHNATLSNLESFLFHLRNSFFSQPQTHKFVVIGSLVWKLDGDFLRDLTVEETVLSGLYSYHNLKYLEDVAIGKEVFEMLGQREIRSRLSKKKFRVMKLF